MRAQGKCESMKQLSTSVHKCLILYPVGLTGAFDSRQSRNGVCFVYVCPVRHREKKREKSISKTACCGKRSFFSPNAYPMHILKITCYIIDFFFCWCRGNQTATASNKPQQPLWFASDLTYLIVSWFILFIYFFLLFVCFTKIL